MTQQDLFGGAYETTDRDDSNSGAIFSYCGRYRYQLWRRWDISLPSILYLMLNPSTADHINNDPTVERCHRRAKANGYGTMLVGNLFALRSTDPAMLAAVDDPIGPSNDSHLIDMAADVDMICCGWGNHGRLHNRGEIVEEMLRKQGHILHCLGRTGADQPCHPLYRPYRQPFKVLDEIQIWRAKK